MLATLYRVPPISAISFFGPGTGTRVQSLIGEQIELDRRNFQSYHNHTVSKNCEMDFGILGFAKVCISVSIVVLIGISHLVFALFCLLHIGYGRHAVKFSELSVRG